MISKDEALPNFEGTFLRPDRLVTPKHEAYLGHAEKMLDLYRNGIGKTRYDLEKGVRTILEPVEDCPSKRIDAFIKLLEEGGEFAGEKQGPSRSLRLKVWKMAAKDHPLVREPDRLYVHQESVVKETIAAELGCAWSDVESRLFADVIQFHRLISFDGYPEPRTLLARYNVAQAQTCLYWATKMTIVARDDLKEILRYIKLARLMHSITRLEDGAYQIVVDGPASVLQETVRYGHAMARTLPGILNCKGWSLNAEINHPHAFRPLIFELSPNDGLNAPRIEQAAFDSMIEAEFAKKWGSEPREGWTLLRESDILHSEQTTFVPDFSLQHTSGRRVFFEILGHWTPEYLVEKRNKIRFFSDKDIVLAIPQGNAFQFTDLGVPVVTFKGTLIVSRVLDLLNQ